MSQRQNSASRDCQVNVHLSPEQFERIFDAAKKQRLSPMQFCREAAIIACERDLRPEETPLLAGLKSLLANLHGELVTLRTDLRSDLAQSRNEDGRVLTYLGAVLEEVLGVRFVLLNTANVLGHGKHFEQGEFADLKKAAAEAKLRNAQRVITAATSRLNPPAAEVETAPQEVVNA